MADSKKVLKIIQAISFKMEEQKDYLTELDQPIGDSDHGINLARGFAAVNEKLSGLEGKDIGTILKTVGMTLVSTVGGASGPLYGSAFMKAGQAMAGKEDADITDFLTIIKTAIEAVELRGKAVVEEATKLDAMVPSYQAMEQA
ncbi:MAG TPA: dihydroxyacetone kinase subunit L, partial [Clostridium sp.]|nr:dihydroxyacetone kinase subunit L [Clostridium sp.]